MEGINTSKPVDRNSSVLNPVDHSVTSHTEETLSSTPKVDNSVAINLPDLANLTDNAQNSASDLRSEFINRARSLITDDNWLSDKNIDLLASKIAQVENI